MCDPSADGVAISKEDYFTPSWTNLGWQVRIDKEKSSFLTADRHVRVPSFWDAAISREQEASVIARNEMTKQSQRKITSPLRGPTSVGKFVMIKKDRHCERVKRVRQSLRA